MCIVTQLTELDYDAIENAVMATARGRWFLSEYKKRHGDTGTPKILDAIARLEKVITSINIDELAQKPQKTAQPVAPAFVPAVVDIPKASDTTTPEAKPLSKENLQFFSNDEDLFADDTSSFLPEAIPAKGPVQNAAPEDPAPKADPAPEKASTAPEPEQTPASTSDRFKVFKKSPDEIKADESAPTKELAPDNVPDPTMQPTEEEQDRIVVIRNTTGDDIDIPLADELGGAAKSEKPVTATN